MALISWVVDLDAPSPQRMPDAAAAHTTIAGITLPRLAIAAGCDPIPLVLAAVTGRSRRLN
jgi:hypothetical protein